MDIQSLQAVTAPRAWQMKPLPAAGFAEALDAAVKKAEDSQKDAKDPKQAAAAQGDKKMRDACRDMEAVFINYMLSQMRATLPKTSWLGENSNSYSIVQSMMDTELSKNMSAGGGIGLADMIYRQLKQEEAGRAQK